MKFLKSIKKDEIIEKVSRTASKYGYKLKKASPTIMIVGAAVGGVTATVLACKATIKAQDILAEHNAEVESIHTAKEQIESGDIQLGEGETYTEKDFKNDITTAYVQTGLKLAKTYAPAAPGSVEETIEQFLTGLLKHMGSEAVPHAWKDEEGAYQVDLVGDDLGYLIGRRGDTLDAIQHLCNYAVNRGVEGHVRVHVDAEEYRVKREESLRRYARKKAQQVLKARRRTTLEPMNAYERHVIHATLQDMENITTHSTGTEPNRRVVIEYVR